MRKRRGEKGEGGEKRKDGDRETSKRGRVKGGEEHQEGVSGELEKREPEMSAAEEDDDGQ